MKKNVLHSVPYTAVVLALLTITLCASAEAARLPAPAAYAEGLYAEYAAATGDQVAFEVKTLGAGSLQPVSRTPFGELVEPPGFRLEARQFGTEIREPRILPAVITDVADLDATAEGFEAVGYPLELGHYRKLGVETRLGTARLHHEALEFCWPSLGHCAVFDPAVTFLQSMVENRLRLAAEGWGPRVELVRNDGDRSLAGTCGLASNPGITSRSYYWGAYWVEYRDIFGIVLVRKDVGSQKAGMRCDGSCLPVPFGYSNASSCYGTLGWNCACDNDFGFGTGGNGGRSGKWIAEAKCTHRWVGSARASATIFDQGTISVDIQWDVDGGEDSNGGEVIDTCGFF